MEIRKFVGILAIAAFVLFESSCLAPTRSRGFQKTVKKDIGEVDRGDTGIRIVNVITKSGENIAFENKSPAGFVTGGTAVVGVQRQNFVFEKKDVKISYKEDSKKIIRIETLDGRTYDVASSKETADKVSVMTRTLVTIPYEDIRQVWIRKTNVGGIIITALVVVGGAIAVTAIAMHEFSEDWERSWESCPFIYSYDGERYVLDAEPYGMAVSEGLKRTDWVELASLRAVDGRYRVLLANELDETQYTDELKLVAVDHSSGTTVAPDVAGGWHTFARPASPSRAVDGKGRDILKFVAANDRIFWTSPLEEKSPDDADMRDELVFEFPKPAGAMRAKLLANVWTTQWGSLSAGRFLGLFGSSLDESLADIDRHGPAYRTYQNWMSSQELYTMKACVETPSGWRERGMIYGGAPVVARDKAYVLDIADVPSEILRIKLRPPVNFWMINALAVEYGEDSPVRATQLAALGAVDPQGRDVRNALAATDGSYLASPKPGERTALEFDAPPLPGGLVRTVFVKASGYYRLHLDSKRAPQTDLLARVLSEPDFAARYSLREYRKREAALLARMEGTRRR